ncbi:hypothetical protein ABW19_dt0210207 [Dactylella cylindrospora]|nr:hypothetical protein ABW19_dt0210207 [Dactylella cylindrospora]
MGVTMSTIVQWTVIIAVVGAYFYLTNKRVPTALGQKPSGGSRLKDVGNFEDTSGTEKKKKGSKKDKKQQKAAVATPKDLQVPRVTLESESNDDAPESAASRKLEEDKGSLQRLAGFKTGQAKTTKPEPKPEKKKNDKQGKTTASMPPPEQKLTAVPISPSLGGISSTSSTTGADGDIDEPDSVDEDGYQHPAGDMLETVPGASILRITPVQDEFTTVTRKKGNQQAEKKEGLTPLQKKNQKKNELKKELKKLEKEDQTRRLEAHKKEQRVAREAEAVKSQKKNPPPPASNAWSASTGNQDGQSPAATGLLDTFDSSNSNPKSVITPSSSDIESGQYPGLSLSADQRQDIPKEVLAEYYAEQRELAQPEKEWVEVKRPRRERKKPLDTESETDSDARRDLTSSTLPTTAASNTAQQGQQKPKKQFTEQDLRIPAMPAAENSDGWDAHAW